MFHDCEKLVLLDISNLDITHIDTCGDLRDLLSGCKSLEKVALNTNLFKLKTKRNVPKILLEDCSLKEQLSKILLME